MQVSGVSSIATGFRMPNRRSSPGITASFDAASFSSRGMPLTQPSTAEVLSVKERMYFNRSFGMDLLDTAKGSVSEFASSFMNQQEINFFEQFQRYENTGSFSQQSRTLGVSVNV